jgi:hypothetical protein
MLLALAHSGALPLPSRETMCELSPPSVGRHEHLAEYFRIKYLAMLAKYIYSPDNEEQNPGETEERPRVVFNVPGAVVGVVSEAGIVRVVGDAATSDVARRSGHLLPSV